MEEVQDANKEDGSFKVGKAGMKNIATLSYERDIKIIHRNICFSGGLSKIEGSEPIQPKRAASKIYPLIAVSEVECQKLFHDALKTFGLQNGRNNCIVAIKTADTGMLYLVQAQKKSAEVVVGTTRSVLKSTFARGSLADFEDCTVIIYLN